MRGGKRKGAGRKANGIEKTPTTINLDKEIYLKAKEKFGRNLSTILNEYLKTLLKSML
jgi:hypothetical protein